jgi:hypothetical protein
MIFNFPSTPHSIRESQRDNTRAAIDISINARDWQSSDGDFQGALLRALEHGARSRWRVVCPNILVECIEPYRTLVIKNEVLQALREQQRLFHEHMGSSASTPAFEAWHDPIQISAELHTPLAEGSAVKIKL